MMQLLPVTFILALASAAGAATFRDLPADVKAQVDLRLTRPSNEIAASPFATLTSFEVHGESEDDGVIETMRRLGVKTVVMHNIHGSLPNAQDRRLHHWLDACDKAGIETRCILHSTDLNLWRQALTNYGRRIRHWSFLNEPNAPTQNDHSRPMFMPERYVELLAQVACECLARERTQMEANRHRRGGGRERWFDGTSRKTYGRRYHHHVRHEAPRRPRHAAEVGNGLRRARQVRYPLEISLARATTELACEACGVSSPSSLVLR